jgi:hypothetical protein
MTDEPDVSETVFQQYRDVQQSGLTNMVMKSQVRRVAESMGHTELVRFIDGDDYYALLENYEQLQERYA